MGQAVEVEFTLTRAEFSKAFRAFALRGWGYRIAFGLLVLTAALSGLFGGLQAAAPVLFVGSVFALAVSLVPTLLWRASEHVREQQQIVVEDEQVTSGIRSKRSRFTWNRFEQAIETADLYLLCESRRFFIIVPKRAFDRPEDDQRFRASLTSNNLL